MAYTIEDTIKEARDLLLGNAREDDDACETCEAAGGKGRRWCWYCGVPSAPDSGREPLDDPEPDGTVTLGLEPR